ncbi:MAG: (Fe-S)-binding protein [Nitrospinae bacterium]|nr:(Fe-S)-binding protein [Nitrospinota bacterium]
MEATAYQKFMEERITQITEACTHCGKCYEVCPMVEYSQAKGAEPERVTKSVIDILNNRPHEPEGALWAKACQKSGICIEACPEDVNPREMLTYAKLKLQNIESGEADIQEAGRAYFQDLSRKIRFMAALQLEPEQFRHLTAVRGYEANKVDAVFYFGCNILQTPHILLSCIDVFDRLGLDYEVAGGVGHCCGINHIRRGDLETGAEMGARSLDHFKSYDPEKVITFCPTCQMQYSEYQHLYTGKPVLPVLGDSGAGEEEILPFVHITQYLADNLEALRGEFTQKVEKRVAVHLHGGSDGVEENVITILKAVPGLEFVEIEQLSDHAYQCPTLVIPEAKAAMREKLFDSARRAEVDSLLTVYHSCHRELCDLEKDEPFAIENFMTILGQAMGFEYPDYTKTYKIYEDIDRVIHEAEDALRAFGVAPEKMREQLQTALYG